MDGDDNVYVLEHKGLLTLDKFLIAFCVGIIPGYFAILSSNRTLSDTSKFWAALLLYCVPPTLFCLLWHSFRWPVRLAVIKKSSLEACKALSGDLIHFQETIVKPTVKDAIAKLPTTKGKDGEEYVFTKDAQEVFEKSFGMLSSKNPIVDNILYSHSVKIFKANRNAAIGLLDERNARLKQIADNFCRYARYWLFIAVVFCALQFGISLLR